MGIQVNHTQGLEKKGAKRLFQHDLLPRKKKDHLNRAALGERRNSQNKNGQISDTTKVNKPGVLKKKKTLLEKWKTKSSKESKPHSIEEPNLADRKSYRDKEIKNPLPSGTKRGEKKKRNMVESNLGGGKGEGGGYQRGYSQKGIEA